MKTFQELKRNLKKDLGTLQSVKVALLGDSATQFLATAVRGMAVDHKCNYEFFEADFNQIEMQIENPTSELHEFAPEYIIVFQSSHKLLETYSLLSPNKRLELFDDRLDFVKKITSKLDAHIIYFNYSEIDDSVFGSYSNSVKDSFLFQLRKLNVSLMEIACDDSHFHICDLSSIQNKFGRDLVYPASIYMTTELLISLEVLPYVASRVVDIIDAIRGKIKKCLILDLDNTLWGGVIGDDGMEKIRLGHGLGIGKAFSEFQEWIKKLQQRGIILAVCSKNTESIAKEPFEKHPEMVLRLDDIAIFVANWNSKVENIKYIQQVLNIGMDSMVFLDDNPYERNVVREQIPEITVPELPKDPADYLEYLYSLNLFEIASYSEADAQRTKQYQVESKRAELKKSFASEQDFLKNLEMTSKVELPNNFNIPRIAQLSQRSNQFNLRTVRYSEADIRLINENPENGCCLSFTLEDKFGDNGLVSVVVLRRMDEEKIFIENWFMSCRVLKRGLENFVLNAVADYARKNGYKMLIGEYLPTLKNSLVKEHYQGLGFTQISDSPAQYSLNLATFKNRETFISFIGEKK